MILPYKAKDHKGQIFGRLTAIEPVGITTKGRYIIWKCICTCGNVKEIKSAHLVSGATQSCGCLAKEQSAKRMKMSHNHGEHLYFIKCNDFVKIGRTDNVKTRVKQIQANCPYEISVIKILKGQGHREKEYHKLYDKYHHRGEWFKIVDIT